MALAAFSAFAPLACHAAPSRIDLKLPYPEGEQLFVVQGYHMPPTHIKKDAYALDFTGLGCDAYGGEVVASASGTVMFMNQKGYNGGYGTEVIIDHGNGVVSRYAHMIPDSIMIGPSVSVRRGEVIGRIGNTGLVSGAACADHPGTHLHFAMDTVQPDGTFIAYDPGPISGYAIVSAGRWYRSDNADDGAVLAIGDSSSGASPVLSSSILGSTTVMPSATPVASTVAATVPAALLVASTTTVFAPPSTPTPTRQPNSPVVSVFPSGGVLSIPPSSSSSQPEVFVGGVVGGTGDDASGTDRTAATSTDPGAIDPVGGVADETGGNSTSSTTTAPAGSTGTVLFEQEDDTVESVPSWYSDNWFALGKGFSGMLTTLTLKGRTNGARYVPLQQFSLQEFKDASYTAMTNDFPLVGPSFIPEVTTAMFDGLSILLKPYFYYRLTTSESLQNGSIILDGTASTTAGVAMYNEFIYGTGRVEYTNPFLPFMVMKGVATSSPSIPPPLSAPGNVTMQFDPMSMTLSLSFTSSTDPDWPAAPLRYEMNYSTSSMLDDGGWKSVGSVPLVFGNRYLIGVRARDNFGDISAPATATWDFPEGFTPYRLSPGLGVASQFFVVHETSTLRSIDIFVTDFGTSAKNPLYVDCSLLLFEELPDGSLASTTPDNSFNGVQCGGDLAFRFASPPPILYPGHHYHWTFAASTGNPSTGAGVRFYGTGIDTAGGPFSDPSLANARFVLTGDGGVIFSN